MCTFVKFQISAYDYIFRPNFAYNLCGSSILRVLKSHSNGVYYWFHMYFSPTYTQHINELYTKLCPILWFQTYYSNIQNDINANK